MINAMSDEKLRQPPKETRPPLVDDKMREMLEDYANDLRAIMERLRKKLN
jgi:hypothetical protein